MGLRIVINPGREVTVVRIDGDLGRANALQLVTVCHSIAGAVCVDLARLQSIDAGGVETVHRLVEQGVAVAGVLPHIQKLLDRPLH